MIKGRFVFEEDRLKNEILRHHPRKVLLQLPEGLKPEGPRIAAVIEDAGATAIISADPCYGACDLPLCEAGILGVDLIVHYGHTEMMKKPGAPAPILYFEAKTKVDTRAAVKKAVILLEPWKRIGLATTVQHIDMVNEARMILGKAGKRVYLGDASQMKYPGQIVGCDYSNAKSISDKAEAFLFIGGGRFHAIGLALATMKPTIIADPFENTTHSVQAEVEKIVRRRWAEISEAKRAAEFGILIGLKPGQCNINAALKIKHALEEAGKKAVLLALREITSAALLQFPMVEAYVNTACPRIALDQPPFFTKAVLTVRETCVALGRIGWEDLLKEGFI